MSGCGWTLAASTSEAAQSYPRPLIPCIGGTQTRKYAMCTSTTSPVHPFPLREIDFNGWPEWFSRRWTLQELIAPTNVQFLNKNWQTIGDKRTLAPILEYITGVPEDILVDGLRGNRPCVAQIMSWAAHRTTTRVEDRAYSLMGLLDINMPMLYGEGRKAFHRLQLETIRTSNDQSIFAWYILTDKKGISPAVSSQMTRAASSFVIEWS